MTRYAIYYAPRTNSPWWRAGCNWLGRDPERGITCTSNDSIGAPTPWHQLTQEARRYGFHATLKAPFELACGFEETHLLTMARSFALHQRPLAVIGPTVRPLGHFLALQPAKAQADIAALAMRCVSYFDLLRAPLTPAELTRRRRAGLSLRQEALLQRWGYPYTEEEFRFHLTLSDRLDGADAQTVHGLRKAAESCFANAIECALVIDGIAVFREAEPGADFTLLARLPFSDALEAQFPRPGRLYYLVGPSGSGKDTLLRWVQQHLPQHNQIVFARRCITRMQTGDELHEPLSTEAFWQASAKGAFAIQWQANGSCYGVRRSIEAELCAGRDVIVNGSRAYVPRLRQSYPEARVIWVETEIHQIQRRIEQRRREGGAALLHRMQRVSQFLPENAGDVIRLDNNGTIETAGAKLMALLS